MHMAGKERDGGRKRGKLESTGIRKPRSRLNNRSRQDFPLGLLPLRERSDILVERGRDVISTVVWMMNETHTKRRVSRYCPLLASPVITRSTFFPRDHGLRGNKHACFPSSSRRGKPFIPSSQRFQNRVNYTYFAGELSLRFSST